MKKLISYIGGLIIFICFLYSVPYYTIMGLCCMYILYMYIFFRWGDALYFMSMILNTIVLIYGFGIYIDFFSSFWMCSMFLYIILYVIAILSCYYLSFLLYLYQNMLKLHLGSESELNHILKVAKIYSVFFIFLIAFIYIYVRTCYFWHLNPVVYDFISYGYIFIFIRYVVVLYNIYLIHYPKFSIIDVMDTFLFGRGWIRDIYNYSPFLTTVLIIYILRYILFWGLYDAIPSLIYLFICCVFIVIDRIFIKYWPVGIYLCMVVVAMISAINSNYIACIFIVTVYIISILINAYNYKKVKNFEEAGLLIPPANSYSYVPIYLNCGYFLVERERLHICSDRISCLNRRIDAYVRHEHSLIYLHHVFFILTCSSRIDISLVRRCLIYMDYNHIEYPKHWNSFEKFRVEKHRNFMKFIRLNLNDLYGERIALIHELSGYIFPPCECRAFSIKVVLLEGYLSRFTEDLIIDIMFGKMFFEKLYEYEQFLFNNYLNKDHMVSCHIIYMFSKSSGRTKHWHHVEYEVLHYCMSKYNENTLTSSDKYICVLGCLGHVISSRYYLGTPKYFLCHYYSQYNTWVSGNSLRYNKIIDSGELYGIIYKCYGLVIDLIKLNEVFFLKISTELSELRRNYYSYKNGIKESIYSSPGDNYYNMIAEDQLVYEFIRIREMVFDKFSSLQKFRSSSTNLPVVNLVVQSIIYSCTFGEEDVMTSLRNIHKNISPYIIIEDIIRILILIDRYVDIINI